MQLILALCVACAVADPAPKSPAETAIATAGRVLTAASPALIGPGTLQIIGGLNNVLSNWHGIRANPQRQFEKLTTVFALGMASGAADWGNLVTSGASHDAFAKQSAQALALSHSVTFDKKPDDTESFDVAYHVLSKIYAYGPQGTWTKIGGDVQWNHHLLLSDEVNSAERLAESQRRFHYMGMKMQMQGAYAVPVEGSNRDHAPGQTAWNQGKKNGNFYGHWLLGRFLGPKLMYYGFEVWGEPYVPWEIDDYYDDGNPLDTAPMDGPYDTRF